MRAAYCTEDQRLLLIYCNYLRDLYSEVVFGSALSLPQPMLPFDLWDDVVDSSPCDVSGANWCHLADGSTTPLLRCCAPGCTVVRHAHCHGGGSMYCSKHAHLSKRSDRPGSPDVPQMSLQRQHGVVACYGVTPKMGSWLFLLGSWPLQRGNAPYVPFSAHTVAAALHQAKMHMSSRIWVTYSSTAHRCSSMADYMRQCGIRGYNQRTLTLIGVVYAYGHIMQTGRRSQAHCFMPNGRLRATVHPTEPKAAVRLQSATPFGQSDVLMNCMLTEGFALTLQRLSVYHPLGYDSTLQVFDAVHRRCDGARTVDQCMIRWVSGNFGMVHHSEPPADCCGKEAAKRMHSSVYAALLSSKTSARASAGTHCAIWCALQEDPVWSPNPLEMVCDVTGVDSERVAEFISEIDVWVLNRPLLYNQSTACDACTVFCLHVTMNPTGHHVEFAHLCERLDDVFGSEFSASCREAWLERERAPLPLVLSRSHWIEFRQLCVDHPSYGIAYMFMAVHGDSIYRGQHDGRWHKLQDFSRTVLPCSATCLGRVAGERQRKFYRPRAVLCGLGTRDLGVSRRPCAARVPHVCVRNRH